MLAFKANWLKYADEAVKWNASHRAWALFSVEQTAKRQYSHKFLHLSTKKKKKKWIKQLRMKCFAFLM